MKQLLILSGKGGTGKTTLASALIKISGAKTYADCDVDTPNLHLLIWQHAKPQTAAYHGLPKAIIDSAKCIRCDRCREHCRYQAITAENGYRIDPLACEGCAVCQLVCPAAAITLQPAVAGTLRLHVSPDHVFSTAQLKMGSGNTGKLVAAVKKRMLAAAAPTAWAIIDGAPGIGCPVIASLSGVDWVLMVTEPSVSGRSDLERVVETAAPSGAQVAVCVNRYDTNPLQTRKIERYCRDQKLSFVGKIPYVACLSQTNHADQTLFDVDVDASTAVRTLYQNLMCLMTQERKVRS